VKSSRHHARSVVALHTGTPKRYVDDDGRVWSSSIGRTRRTESVRLGFHGFEGDAPADSKNHGEPNRAVCVYPLEHLDHWVETFNRPDIVAGAFGENLTVGGVNEADVSLGDVRVVGGATLEVSQPRSARWKLARHLGISELVRAVRDCGRTGWYLRVLKPGWVEPGDAIDVVDHPFQRLTISAVTRARWSGAATQLNASLASCPPLSDGRKAHFASRVSGELHRRDGTQDAESAAASS
jgi:MOSC domain-containing protein YiiM